jgi:hypothetical protein
MVLQLGCCLLHVLREFRIRLVEQRNHGNRAIGFSDEQDDFRRYWALRRSADLQLKEQFP